MENRNKISTNRVNDKDNKFKDIEFLRFFLSCVILVFHLNSLFWGKGYLAVDFFFIISGFFLISKFDKNLSFIDFIKKKIIRLWPLMVFVNFLYLIIHIFAKSVKYHKYDNLLESLFLGNIGLTISRGNLGAFWYVSVLFWCSLLYFYLLKYFERKNVNLFVALSVWFSYTFLIHAKNGVVEGLIETFNNIFVVGILRGLGGIGIGYFIGLFYKMYENRINSTKLNKTTTLFITVLEVYLFSWSLYYLILHKISYKNDIISILYFTILFILFLIKKGLFTRLLDNNYSVILGRYSYSIYSVHLFVMDLLINTFWKSHKDFVSLHPVTNFTVTVLLVFIFAILTYHFVEKPSAKYLSRKFFHDGV